MSDVQDFTRVNGCVCPGYDTVFECTAVGNGFTQWSGSAFDCEGLGNEIFLSHDDFDRGIRKECNNGAIVGRNLQVNGSCYTSQLTVNISANLNGKTIECTYDSGRVLEPIGSTTIMITTGSGYAKTCMLYIVSCNCRICKDVITCMQILFLLLKIFS